MLWLPVSKHKRADYLLQKPETPMLIHLQDKNRIRHTLSINTDWRRATASCNKLYDSLANAHKKLDKTTTLWSQINQNSKVHANPFNKKQKVLSQCLPSEALSLLYKYE